jgi:hypothetical protein
MPSEALGPGEMDRTWTLAVDPTGEAEPNQPSLGDTKLPHTWTIRYTDNLILSTVTLVRATDTLREQEPNEIEFSLSQEYADSVVNTLGKIRSALNEIRGLTETGTLDGRREWARAMATAMLRIEQITRRLTATDSKSLGTEEDPFALPSGPVLDMVAGYLDEQSKGALLSDAGPAETRTLRTMLAQTTLKMGFAGAGHRLPAELPAKVASTMSEAASPEALKAELTRTLTEALAEAPSGQQQRRLREDVRDVLKGADKGLAVLQRIIGQWDRMDHVQLRMLSRNDEPVVEATIRTQPDRTVRVADMVIAQPTMVFRGETRIVTFAEPETGERVVLFEPVGRGGVELRFEGIIWGLAKLFAFPLEDGRLREIRTLVETQGRGRSLIHVSVKMESLRTDGDRRRLLMFQDARVTTVRRRLQAVESVVQRMEQSFHYVTPEKRYTFQRVKKDVVPQE